MACPLVTTTPIATRPALRASATTAVDLLALRQQPVLGRRRRRAVRRVLAREGLELELLEEGVGGGPVGLLATQRVEVQLDGGVGAQRDELLRQERGRPGGSSAPRGRPRASPRPRARGPTPPGRTRRRGRARPCRRSRGRRARCPPRRRRGRARPRCARGGRPTSPRPPCGRSASSRSPRGRGSARGRRRLTSCSRSLSAETTTTFRPCSTACRAMVAIVSSASKPGTSTTGIRSASHTLRMYGTCTARSSSIFGRLALYSAYCSWRNVFPGGSKRTATCSGFSSSRSFRSIVVKP